MGDVQPRANEVDEIGQIDYFLDQLARAVEHGEVHRASYDLLAPRYLQRRADLVASLQPRTARADDWIADEDLWDDGDVNVSAARLPAGWLQPATPEVVRSTPAVAPRAAPASVNWTTVLLFLGAFLVISASAIFALTVWNSVGPFVKLAFMGATTLLFYGAGYYASVKLKLKAGGTALTVVGSAMLLFDGWLIIDTFHLSGPLPWAVVLLAISAVYWLTEVALGQRMYGVAGAAAQIAWWWLLADALNLDPIVRIAVIALIAGVWQLLAERGVAEEATASLSEVLLWAAPVVELLAAVGAIGVLLYNSPSDFTAVTSAVVTSAAGAVVVIRSRHVAAPADRWLAGMLQVPVFVAILTGTGASWPGFAALLALAAGYTLAAVTVFGPPMAIPAAVAELLAWAALRDLLHLDRHWTVGLLVAISVSWVAAAYLVEEVADRPLPEWLAEADSTAATLRILGLLGMVLASAGAIWAATGIVLTGTVTSAADAVLAAVVLAGWAGASLLPRRPLPAVATVVWSFYALATVTDWVHPGGHSVFYAGVLLGLAFLWLLASIAVERFYDVPALAFGWAMRGALLLAWLVGLVAERIYFPGLSAWPVFVFTLVAAAAFLADAFLTDQPVTAAAGAVALVLAGDLLGTIVHGPGLGALAAGSAALATVAVAWAMRSSWRDRSRALAVAAAAAATLACLPGRVPEWWLAGALALAAIAWAGAAVIAWEELSFASAIVGLAALAALLSAADAASWITVASFGTAGLLLGLPSVMASTRKGSAHERVGMALAVAGGLGLAWMVPVALSDFLASWAGWLHFGPHGLTLILIFLGGYLVAQAVIWGVELLVYVGSLCLLVALLAEMNSRHFTTEELYSTPVALYFVAMGYLYRAWDSEHRTYPAALDLVAVLIGLGVPVVLALSSAFGAPMFVHTSWAIGLSLLAIGAGIVVRSRALLFGGAAALAVVAGWRTISYLAEFWWLVLGLIGVSLLVVALTWERQRQLIGETRARLRDGFEGWR